MPRSRAWMSRRPGCTSTRSRATRCARASSRQTGRWMHPYLGRSAYLTVDRLHELWIQVNDFCNLACAHCLVSSGPTEGHGLTTGRLRDVIDQAVTLGVERFFSRAASRWRVPTSSIWPSTSSPTTIVNWSIMTNGTVFSGGRLERLRALAVDPTRADTVARADDTAPEPKLRVQISLDGASATTNDPIRGPGSFDRIVAGIRAAVNAGLRPTLTATILRHTLRTSRTSCAWRRSST